MSFVLGEAATYLRAQFLLACCAVSGRGRLGVYSFGDPPRFADHTRRFSNLAQMDCSKLNGDTEALFGFETWLCLASCELAYCQRLPALLKTNLVISAGFGVTPALLCLGQRVPRGFCFLPNERGSGGRGLEARGGVHTQYNSYVRQAMRWMKKQRVLLEYHNIEVYCVSSAGIREMYAPLTDE